MQTFWFAPCSSATNECQLLEALNDESKWVCSAAMCPHLQSLYRFVFCLFPFAGRKEKCHLLLKYSTCYFTPGLCATAKNSTWIKDSMKTNITGKLILKFFLTLTVHEKIAWVKYEMFLYANHKKAIATKQNLQSFICAFILELPFIIPNEKQLTLANGLDLVGKL